MKVQSFSCSNLVTLALVTAVLPSVRPATATPHRRRQGRGVVAEPARPRDARSLSRSRWLRNWPRRNAEHYTWVATDTTGYSPGFEVRGADGRDMERQTRPRSTNRSRGVTCACGRLVITSRSRITSRAGSSPAALAVNSRGRDCAPSHRGQTSSASGRGPNNDFVGTQPYRGLIAANILINSWDWKTNNNRIYRMKTGWDRGAASSCATSAHRSARRQASGSSGFRFPCAGWVRASRNSIADFESQKFIKRVGENEVDFDFAPFYGSVVDLVRPADVRWTADLMSKLSRCAAG